jgi:hypothetical protein
MRTTGATPTVEGTLFSRTIGAFMCVDTGVPSLQRARIKPGEKHLGVRDARHFD